jgi:hypothetical protein
MKKELRVAASPLTGTIFAGYILKSGMWSSNKQDVTLEALLSVVDHVTKFKKPVEIYNNEGKIIHKITVESFI